MDEVSSIVAVLAGFATIAAFFVALFAYLNFNPRALSIDIYLQEEARGEPSAIVVRIVNKSNVEIEIIAAYFGVGSEETDNPIEFYEATKNSRRKLTGYLEGQRVPAGGTVSGIISKNISPIQASGVLVNESDGCSREDFLDDFGDPNDDTKSRVIVVETTRGTRRIRLRPDILEELPQESNEDYLNRSMA